MSATHAYESLDKKSLQKKDEKKNSCNLGLIIAIV